MTGLFTLQNAPTEGSNESTVNVTINASHAIFNGHFPDRPILPGVCMAHIAVQIAACMHGKPLRILSARSIKFLAPVDPTVSPELVYRTVLSNGEHGVKADVQALAGDQVVMKLLAELVPEE